jgi:hypothetical protein
MSFPFVSLPRQGPRTCPLSSASYHIKLLVSPCQPRLSRRQCPYQAVTRWDDMPSHAPMSCTCMACHPWPQCLIKLPPKQWRPPGLAKEHRAVASSTSSLAFHEYGGSRLKGPKIVHLCILPFCVHFLLHTSHCTHLNMSFVWICRDCLYCCFIIRYGGYVRFWTYSGECGWDGLRRKRYKGYDAQRRWLQRQCFLDGALRAELHGH